MGFLESEPAELINKAKEKLTEKGLGDLYFQGQIEDYKRVLKDLGYAEIKSDDILKTVEEELTKDDWSEIRQVYIQNTDRAKVREKLIRAIDKASQSLTNLTEDERQQIIEEITKQTEEIIYQSLTSEALFETMKLDKSKIWNIAKQWGKRWGLRVALSMGIGIGVSSVLGATIFTGGAALLPVASALTTGGILSGLNVFENSKWGRWLAGKMKGDKDKNKSNEFQEKFQQAVESDKILHSEKLSGVFANQINIMASRKAREKLHDYEAAQTTGQDYAKALKGIEPILFGQASTYVENQTEYKDLPANEKEKIAFLIARLLGEEERNKSAIKRSQGELQKKEPRIYQILEKFNGLRAGSLTAKKEETGRQIGLTAGTIALGAGTSAAYSFLRTTEHWSSFKAVSAILGAAGLGGAGLIWAKIAEAKKEYAVMQEIDNLLKLAEEKIKDAGFPDPLPESLREDKNLVQARLEEGILARNPVLTARAENFIRRVEELEYKYSQGLEEILGEINKDTKAIEIRKADDIKKLQKAAKTRKALYAAGFGALGAMLGLAGASGSEAITKQGGVVHMVNQVFEKEAKSSTIGVPKATAEVPTEQSIHTKTNVSTSAEELALTIRRGQSVESVASKLYQQSGFARNSKQASIEVARQLVFQYLEEHKNDPKYKSIYEDLVQYAQGRQLKLITHKGITEAMHHVKIKDFNDIYQNKVPNLVHPGDKLTVDENGWIKYPERGHIKVALPVEHTKGGEQEKSLPVVPHSDELESGPRVTEYSDADAGNVKPNGEVILPGKETAMDIAIHNIEAQDTAPQSKIDEFLVDKNLHALIAQGEDKEIANGYIPNDIGGGIQRGYQVLEKNQEGIPTKIGWDLNNDSYIDVKADVIKKFDGTLVAEVKEFIFDAGAENPQRIDVFSEGGLEVLASKLGGNYLVANETLRSLKVDDKWLLFCGNSQVEVPQDVEVVPVGPQRPLGGETLDRPLHGFVLWNDGSKQGVLVLDINQTGNPQSWDIKGGSIDQALQNRVRDDFKQGVDGLQDNFRDVFAEEVSQVGASEQSQEATAHNAPAAETQSPAVDQLNMEQPQISLNLMEEFMDERGIRAEDGAKAIDLINQQLKEPLVKIPEDHYKAHLADLYKNDGQLFKKDVPVLIKEEGLESNDTYKVIVPESVIAEDKKWIRDSFNHSLIKLENGKIVIRF